MRALIAVLPGDGIGPEVCAEAVRALTAVAAAGGHSFEFEHADIGGIAIDRHGDPLPQSTLALCRRADAVLLGAVGGPKWSSPSATVRPEQGLLLLRQELGLFANLRPVAPHPVALKQAPIKANLLTGVDILVVRELTGGIYFGERSRTEHEAMDVCRYTVAEVERVTRRAAQFARARRGKLTHVDKANVLDTSRLWRATVERVVRAAFPDLELEHQLVDSMAMHLIARPRDFDVVLTENLFGDILTDEAALLAGSMGLLPSASLGEGTLGVYEPIHGSAPDIAGRGIANPFGAILSGAMLLRHSLGLDSEARAIEQAVSDALDAGVLTRDLRKRGAWSTEAAGTWVARRIEATAQAVSRAA